MHQFVEPFTPMEEPITNVLREALINRVDREDQYAEIMRNLACSRNKAKQLYFAFLYYATEEYLERMLIEEELVGY